MRRREATFWFSPNVRHGEMDYTLDVQVRCYYDPGRAYGPPENCWPPEGEVEILHVLLDGRELDEREWGRWADLLQDAAWGIFQNMEDDDADRRIDAKRDREMERMKERR